MGGDATGATWAIYHTLTLKGFLLLLDNLQELGRELFRVLLWRVDFVVGRGVGLVIRLLLLWRLRSANSI
eukprot:COSAG06_NODE_46_length_29282_cov_16.235770_5_plen_70_part_00